MIIERHEIGAGSRRRSVFAVCNDTMETNDKQPHEIARFDTLETAVAVIRYMRGDSLSDRDRHLAREAIKKVATPAVESIEGSH